MALSETTNRQTIYYWHGLDLLAQSDGTTVSYFEYDGLGSVRQLVDEAGAVLYADTFDPYGNLYASAGADGQTNYAFTGEQQDDNGLLFLRARYYSAESGRFFQTDPSRQERNPYKYVMSNPVRFTDPSGKAISFTEASQAGGADDIIEKLETDYNIKIHQDYGWSYWDGSAHFFPGSSTPLS